MKEQTRNTEVQINEEEIGKLPEKECRIMLVKMMKNFENKMEKMQKSINKDLEELSPRSGVAAKRSSPTSKEWWLHGRRRAERSYSTFKVRRGGCKEIPLVQGKEQWLCFAGAAVKRYPTSKVEKPK